MIHTVICDPADMLFWLPDKAIMRDYVTGQINEMIRNCPALADPDGRKKTCGSVWRASVASLKFSRIPL